MITKSQVFEETLKNYLGPVGHKRSCLHTYLQQNQKVFLKRHKCWNRHLQMVVLLSPGFCSADRRPESLWLTKE